MNEMTCREFDEVVHAFVRLELLDVNLREAALEHAAGCVNCAERMVDAVALAEAVETAGRSFREQQTPPGVEAAVLAAFRSHHRRVERRRIFEWSTVGAAAAVLLIFLWTASGRSKNQVQVFQGNSGKDVAAQSKEPLDVKEAAPAPKKEVTQSAAAPAAAPSANDAPAGETFVASDFVPVPFTGGITPGDPGMVVRVQLTRASLAQLGYPVASMPGDDLIQADVLVGEDGWPRGVRLAR